MLVAATVAIGASLLQSWDAASMPAPVPLILRWVAILLIAAYATSRRSLTGWIFVGLLAGAELGHDWPGVAVSINCSFWARFFYPVDQGDYCASAFWDFGGGDWRGTRILKKVGRLAVKSLVYFEVVSTIAMLIGLAAINLSRAGYGVSLPPAAAGETINVGVPHTATQIITDIFPESIREVRGGRTDTAGGRVQRAFCHGADSGAGRRSGGRCWTSSLGAFRRRCSSSRIW